jgi:hypothetical protein
VYGDNPVDIGLGLICSEDKRMFRFDGFCSILEGDFVILFCIFDIAPFYAVLLFAPIPVVIPRAE